MQQPDDSETLAGVTPASSKTTANAGIPLAVFAIVAGLLGGTAAWAIGEVTYGFFSPPMSKYEMMGQILYKATFEDQLASDAKKATLAYSVLGALLGLSLGLAGGLSRHSTRDAIKAGALGLIFGGLMTFVMSLVMIPVYNRALEKSPEDMSHDLTLPILTHALVWSMGGLIGGGAFGAGLGGGSRRIMNAALGGAIGAAIGAVLFDAAGATFFMDSKTGELISRTWESRFLARMLVAGLAGTVASATVNMESRRTAP